MSDIFGSKITLKEERILYYYFWVQEEHTKDIHFYRCNEVLGRIQSKHREQQIDEENSEFCYISYNFSIFSLHFLG